MKRRDGGTNGSHVGVTGVLKGGKQCNMEKGSSSRWGGFRTWETFRGDGFK